MVWPSTAFKIWGVIATVPTHCRLWYWCDERQMAERITRQISLDTYIGRQATANWAASTQQSQFWRTHRGQRRIFRRNDVAYLHHVRGGRPTVPPKPQLSFSPPL